MKKKLNAHPETQSDPKQRPGTKSHYAYKKFCNTFTDQHGQRITSQRLGGMLVSRRIFKKVMQHLILNNGVATDFQGRRQRQAARNWLSYCIDIDVMDF